MRNKEREGGIERERFFYCKFSSGWQIVYFLSLIYLKGIQGGEVWLGTQEDTLCDIFLMTFWLKTIEFLPSSARAFFTGHNCWPLIKLMEIFIFSDQVKRPSARSAHYGNWQWAVGEPTWVVRALLVPTVRCDMYYMVFSRKVLMKFNRR